MAFANFSEIRKTRGSGLSTLMKQVEKLSSGNDNSNDKDDERFWYPEVDKAGNGTATIRFLPTAPENDYPFVQVFSHGFKNDANGKWYIENCPTTIKQPCPLCAVNSELWNTGTKENQELVRKRKRKLQYIANILVIKDPKNPHNEGQIKLFKFGKKIFDKLTDAMQPKFEDETPTDPFDFWEGANFKLKICKVEGYRNYDRSEFESISAIRDDDEEIESIWKKEHSLKEFIDPSRFKSEAELQAKLTVVLGNGTPIPTAQEQVAAEFEDYVDAPVTPRVAPTRKVDTPPVPPRKAAPVAASDDADEAEYFASLLSD